MPHLLDGWYIYFDKVEVKKRVQSIFGCSITRDSNRECFFRFEIKKTFAPLSIFVFASPVLSLSYLSLVFLTSRFLFEALQIDHKNLSILDERHIVEWFVPLRGDVTAIWQMKWKYNLSFALSSCSFLD